MAPSPMANAISGLKWLSLRADRIMLDRHLCDEAALIAYRASVISPKMAETGLDPGGQSKAPHVPHAGANPASALAANHHRSSFR